MYQYLTMLSPVIRQNLDRADDVANSFSATQLKSKTWLVNELVKVNDVANPRILILGGWYGSFLIPLLCEKLQPSSICITDIDSTTIQIAKQIHKNNPLISFAVLDGDRPNKQFDVDIIINTSCEHMQTIGENTTFSSKCMYVLQSCDNTNDPGHINTVASTGEFLFKLRMSTVLFSGRQNLGHKNRFMVIGRR